MSSQSSDLEARIGEPPFGGSETQIALSDRLAPHAAGHLQLRAQLRNWLEAQGMATRRAQTSLDTTLIKCYAHRNYLQAVLNNPRNRPTASDTGEAITVRNLDAAHKLLTDLIQEEPPPPTTQQLASLAADAVAKATSGLAERLANHPSVRAVAEAVATATARAMVEEMLPPRKLEIHNAATGTIVNVGIQHEQFPVLLRILQAKDHMGYSPNVWLTGPTGSGKTTAAQNVAKALNLPFEAESGLDADYKVMGFIHPTTGHYVETAFFRRFTQGGVILFDEIDNFAPSALLALNSATSNNFCQFPHGIFERHKDCIIIAAANTWGLGATNDYVGRSRLDAASLDRFQPKLNWPVDEKLERAIAVGMDEAIGTQWHDRVLRTREAARKQGLKIIISPRATFRGIALIQQGFTPDETANMTFLAGLSPEQIEAINPAVANRSKAA